MSNTFCLAPYHSFYVDTTNVVRPCCISTLDGPEFSTQEKFINIYNSEQFKNLRRDLSNGVKHPSCDHCWNAEAVGMKSLREGINERYKNDYETLTVDEDFSVNKVNIKYLDIRFNNKCNLKCRTCSPRFSSSWYQDYKTKYPHITLEKKLDSDVTVESIHELLDTVSDIYFAGGEPLITTQHYEILDYLIKNNRTDVSISYNTNFTKLAYQKYDVVEYWKKFRNVRVSASLDGSYQKAEYIRKNLNWEITVGNRERLIKECPNVQFNISCTLSIMNAYDMVSLHKEWVDLKYIEPENFNVNLLFGPEFFNIKNLPRPHKNKLKKLYNDTIEWLKKYPRTENTISGYLSAINLLDQPRMDNWKVQWDEFMLSYDQIRNEDFYQLFTEYNDFLTDTPLYYVFYEVLEDRSVITINDIKTHNTMLFSEQGVTNEVLDFIKYNAVSDTIVIKHYKMPLIRKEQSNVIIKEQDFLKSFKSHYWDNSLEGPQKTIGKEIVRDLYKLPFFECIQSYGDLIQPSSLIYADCDMKIEESFASWKKEMGITNPRFNVEYCGDIWSKMMLNDLKRKLNQSSEDIEYFYTNHWLTIRDNIPYNLEGKVYWCYNRIRRPGKDYACYKLFEEKLLDNGIVSCFNPGKCYLSDYVSINEDVYQEFKKSLPWISDTDDGSINLANVIDERVLQCPINVCTETNFFEDTLFYNEKTIKPILFRQIILPVANYNLFHSLSSTHGFKFSTATYKIDKIQDPVERMNKVMWYLKLFINDRNSLVKELDEVKSAFKHNLNIMISHSRHNFYGLILEKQLKRTI